MTGAASESRAVPFFAWERPGEGTVAVVEKRLEQGRRMLEAVPAGSRPDGAPSFHALPADIAGPPPGTAPLYEQRDNDGGDPVDSTAPKAPKGPTRAKRPLCRVWVNRAPGTLPAQ